MYIEHEAGRWPQPAKNSGIVQQDIAPSQRGNDPVSPVFLPGSLALPGFLLNGFKKMIPILQPKKYKSATKKFRWSTSDEYDLRLVNGYNAGFKFNYHLESVDGIWEIGEKLKLIEERDLFVIRGKPREDYDHPVTRRAGDHYEDVGPHWEHTDRKWLMIDIDDMEGPQDVKYVRGKLPEPFQDVTTFYQWSSSAGMVKRGEDVYDYDPEKSDIRIHLWFWLDRPACSESLREYFKKFDLPIDWKLYNPVQPHYCSAPSFKGGSDPMDKRSDWLPGADEHVELPDCVLDLDDYKELEKKRERQRQKRRQKVENMPSLASDEEIKNRKKKYAISALERAVGQVKSAPSGTRHNTLASEAFSMGTLIGAGMLNEKKTKMLLVKAAKKAGLSKRDAKRTTKDGLRAGKDNPRDLKGIGK